MKSLLHKYLATAWVIRPGSTHSLLSLSGSKRGVASLVMAEPVEEGAADSLLALAWGAPFGDDFPLFLPLPAGALLRERQEDNRMAYLLGY